LLAHGWWFSLCTPVSSTTKTGCHNITEIVLNTIKQPNKLKVLNTSGEAANTNFIVWFHPIRDLSHIEVSMLIITPSMWFHSIGGVLNL